MTTETKKRISDVQQAVQSLKEKLAKLQVRRTAAVAKASARYDSQIKEIQDALDALGVEW